MDVQEELLLREHQHVGSSITTFYMALDRAIALGVVVLGLSAAFGRGRFALMLVPAFLGVIGFYALDLLREIMVLGCYKKQLEIATNKYVEHHPRVFPGRRFTQWDSWVAPPFAVRSAGKIGIWAVYGFIVMVGAATSITAALTYHEDYAGLIQAGVLAFWTIVVSFAVPGIWQAWNVQYLVDDWISWEPDELEWSEKLYSEWKKDWRRRKREHGGEITSPRPPSDDYEHPQSGELP